ncbi:hypothetical protein [Mucilaginibacter sp.]|uniref:hypothetical protein n=1 Tax=Mucilaginibacter sp. TaxID=1882438 RepID=UPI003D0EEDCE
MIPQEVFKRRRRHNNTPESLLLIIANFIVVFVALDLFTDSKHINWFFWVVLAALGVYNYFTIRRNIESFDKVTTITYITTVVLLIACFFIFRGKA